MLLADIDHDYKIARDLFIGLCAELYAPVTPKEAELLSVIRQAQAEYQKQHPGFFEPIPWEFSCDDLMRLTRQSRTWVDARLKPLVKKGIIERTKTEDSSTGSLSQSIPVRTMP